jgi:tRNA-dihydrouridine synthase
VSVLQRISMMFVSILIHDMVRTADSILCFVFSVDVNMGCPKKFSVTGGMGR